MSITRSFLPGDKLRIGINANNFLEGRYHGGYTTTGPGFRYAYSYDYRTWSVGIYLAYNFGSLRSDVRKTRSSVRNDDISSGSSNKSGGN